MAKVLGDFQMYPRGALGRSLGPRIERPPRKFDDLRNGLQYDMSIFEPKTAQMSYNHTVESLWSQLIKQETRMSNFEFRKKVYDEALTAFGTRDFFSWYRVQRFSQFYGANQRDFLEDTLHFILNGRRKIRIETWLALLSNPAQQDVVREAEKPLVKQFFGLDDFDRPTNPSYHENIDLLKVLHKWRSQPNGDDDILGTLHVLFGNV